jgi:hypothetical protein
MAQVESNRRAAEEAIEAEPIANETVLGIAEQTARSYEKSGRLRRWMGRLVLSGICIMPVADVALSDALNVKVVKEADQHLSVASNVAQHAIEDGIVAAFIMGEAVALAEPVRRSRRLKEAGNDFEEYLEERREQFGTTRRIVSNVVNAPYNFLFWAGSKTAELGDRIEKSSKPNIVQGSGGLVRDLGMVNSVGTTAAILYETAAEETEDPSLKREFYLGALFAGSWAVTKELVEGVDRLAQYESTLPGEAGVTGRSVKSGLEGLSTGFDKATGIDWMAPLSTPIATSTMAVVAGMLGYTGWRVAGYHQRKVAMQAAEVVDPVETPPTTAEPVSAASIDD